MTRALPETTLICDACGESFVVRRTRHADLVYCPDCVKQAKAERERVNAKQRPARHVSMDPCPACGVRQADHWKCQRCSSRGHLCGRSALLPEICQDCEQELVKQLKARRV
jgi:hypothetical protein